MTFGCAQNGPRLLSILYYRDDRRLSVYRLNIFSFLALAGEGARDNAPSGFPWQWGGPSGPTAYYHRAEPANAPRTGELCHTYLGVADIFSKKIYMCNDDHVVIK
jgi:hypothetical protein